MSAAPVLALRRVSLARGRTVILDGIDWTVAEGERWVVLGANGSGKTSLVRVASLWLHPSSGEVEVLGATLGRVDVRSHRRRIGLVSAGFGDLLRPSLTPREIVMTAEHAALEPWWHAYDDASRARAGELLDRLGCRPLADRPFSTLSSGERQRVQLARALWADPGLVLLDEPAAGLDLGGREELVRRLAALAADRASPPMVLVTHHVEEIPAGFTHVLLLRAGRVLAAGPLADVLTAEGLGACFGVAVHLARRDGRWQAWST